MSGLYIHIPFCESRCNYCNFYTSTSTGYIRATTQAMLVELGDRADEWSDRQLDTIYFGGGTPSLIDVEILENFLDLANKKFSVSPQAEITIEVNPDDVTSQKAANWYTLGINRISMGVQSFDDQALRFMHRRHTGEQAEQAIKILQNAGFDNISIDLIYGIPKRSDEVFVADINKAIDLGIKHLSAYALTVEDGTALSHDIAKGKTLPVDPDMAASQFELLLDRLSKAGIEQYEISNFAYPSYHSRHNSSYWQGKSYLGIGPSAHSFDGQIRRWNISNIHKYISGVNSGDNYSEQETLSVADRHNEMIMISLRTSRGLSLEDFEKKFGVEALDALLKGLDRHMENGTMEIVDHYARLTPKGRFMADGIASDLFMV